jgi:hypothetical protein
MSGSCQVFGGLRKASMQNPCETASNLLGISKALRTDKFFLISHGFSRYRFIDDARRRAVPAGIWIVGFPCVNLVSHIGLTPQTYPVIDQIGIDPGLSRGETHTQRRARSHTLLDDLRLVLKNDVECEGGITRTGKKCKKKRRGICERTRRGET